jgi:amidophosphoribosyltransferase
MVFLTSNRMVAVRDPWGFRPLCIATLGDSYVVSSETCPFNLIDAQYWREVEPGEVVVFEPGREPSSHFPFPKRKPAECVFEKVYFARPDSMVFGGSANRARHLMGVHLAKEHALEADMVVPIPDSGVPAAAGFAKQSGIAFMHALIRDHYMGRTFIDPQNQVRYQKVRFKFNTIDDLIRGKRVILVDDSLVRGTTTREVVGMVRRAGAAAVSVLISSPSTIDPCFFGIDTPTHDELIAARYTVEEIRQTLGADYLGYLSLKGMLESTDDAENKRTCHACFSGDYPIEVGGGLTKTERDRM